MLSQIMEKEESRLNDIEQEYQKSLEDKKKHKREATVEGTPSYNVNQRNAEIDEDEDMTERFGEVIRKTLKVDRGVKLFMDKETALEEDAADALNEVYESTELPSIDDIALVIYIFCFMQLFFHLYFCFLVRLNTKIRVTTTSILQSSWASWERTRRRRIK